MMTNTLPFEIPLDDGSTRTARFHVPADGEPIATAILAHAFEEVLPRPASVILSRELNRFGIGVLVLETGTESSDSRESAARLVSAAARALDERKQAPFLLIGQGSAGDAMLEIGAGNEAVRAVALIGGPQELAAVYREQSNADASTDPSAASGPEGNAFDGAVLLLLATPGGTAGSREIPWPVAASGRATSILIEGADPQLSGSRDAEYAATMLANWARMHVGHFQEDVKHREKHDNCTVAVIRRDHFRTEILSNGHSLVADEPKEFGGTNMGSTPYGLLLSGLASCTTVTLRMYADRKEWPLESVHVRITHERVHAEDCDCDARGRTGMLDVIRMFVTLEGPLSDAQRERLMQIAEKCPVHRTLTCDPVLELTLLADGGVLACD